MVTVIKDSEGTESITDNRNGGQGVKVGVTLWWDRDTRQDERREGPRGGGRRTGGEGVLQGRREG
jgi:hypothetical protein